MLQDSSLGDAGVIDSHVHLFPPEMSGDPSAYAHRAHETHWGRLMAPVKGRSLQQWPSLEELLAAMDRAGVERAILQGWYWETPESCELHNQFYQELIERHAERFSAMASFHPGITSDPAAWMRCRLAEGFVGLGELLPPVQGMSWDDPRWDPLVGELILAGRPLLFHITEPMGKPYPGKVLTPFDEVQRFLERHRDLTVVLAHWGGLLPMYQLMPGLEGLLDHVVVDTSASPLLYDPIIFSRAPEWISADNILFGSDYPLRLYPKEPEPQNMNPFLAEVREHLPEEHHRKVLRENALRVYGLTKT